MDRGLIGQGLVVKTFNAMIELVAFGRVMSVFREVKTSINSEDTGSWRAFQKGTPMLSVHFEWSELIDHSGLEHGFLSLEVVWAPVLVKNWCYGRILAAEGR